MPELPEIEHLRRTLEPWLVGARVDSVHLRRRGIVRIAGSRKARRGVGPRDLLEGAAVREILRRGKSLAIVADDGRVLAAHMGMTGSMCVETDDGAAQLRDRHVHCEWSLLRGRSSSRMLFRDPRRFGGLWPFASLDDLHTSAGGWSRLGPDALNIDAATLRTQLLRTRQPIKAALLNQGLIAGVGNIYADEALFAAGVHPLARASRLRDTQWRDLAQAIRTIMHAAIESGGSTLRDYRDATGQSGAFAFEHRVYGRGGEACVRCGTPLRTSTVGQRTTVFCQRCQARSFKPNSVIETTNRSMVPSELSTGDLRLPRTSAARALKSARGPLITI